MTSKLLEALETNGQVIANEALIPAISATAFTGGADTVVSAVTKELHCSDRNKDSIGDAHVSPCNGAAPRCAREGTRGIRSGNRKEQTCVVQ